LNDKFDRHQERMHLDTVFNIASDDTVVLLDTIMGEDNPNKRLVTEYTKKGNTYEITQSKVEFSKYLKDQHFKIIPVPESLQKAYGINFINMGNSRLIVLCEEMSKLLKDHGFKEVTTINYKGITNMYGGGHCTTQVFREPRHLKQTDPTRKTDVNPPVKPNNLT